MSLEEIVKGPWKVVSGVDKTVKLAYDAVAALAAKKGFDRFTLAKVSGYSVAVLIGIEGALTLMDQEYTNATYYFGVAALDGLVLPFAASEAREDFSKPKTALNYVNEIASASIKLIRLPTLVLGALYLSPIDIPSSFPDVLSGGLLLSIASCMYFIDGDHTLWDKAKNVAKKAYQWATSMIPKDMPQPLPKPVPVPLQATYKTPT